MRLRGLIEGWDGDRYGHLVWSFGFRMVLYISRRTWHWIIGQANG
jgi:hypothetical protein